MPILLLVAPVMAEQLAAVQPASKFDSITVSKAPSLRLSSGFDVVRGDYGATRATTLSYAPFGLSAGIGRWTFGFDSRYIDLKGPLSFVDITDLGLTQDEANALGFVDDTTTVGFDNVTLSARFAAFEDWRRGLLIDIVTRTTLPTASRAKALGTGAIDTALALEATQFAGRTSWFGTLGYKVRGGEAGRRNSWDASLGFNRTVARRLSWGLSYGARQASAPGVPMTHDVTVFTTLNLDAVSVTAYALTGRPGDHAGTGAGLRFSYSFE
ncbi:MAG: hypothetical protein FJX59_18360 [Alphaproteobacteria bacterium]|nr:hypothetical protein [Alphaproteobacteria bacterium]